MKLLLTSNGLVNESIVSALKDLTQKSFSDCKVAFIPTAAMVEKGDKGWLIRDLENFKTESFKQVDVVDISAVDKSVWLPRLEEAEILVFGGGNTYHLMYWVKKSGLIKILPELLKTKVYVGISAGTIITTPNLFFSNQEKKDFAEMIGEYEGEEGLNFVDFYIRPHFNNPHFPHASLEKVIESSKKVSEVFYAIDDETAIKVSSSDVDVVSEGEWKRFN